MPLFAQPFPPLTNEQASGQPVGRRPDYGQKQDIRFGDDDPNASGLLKIHVSPTRAALRPSTQRDFEAGYRSNTCLTSNRIHYLSSDVVCTIPENSRKISGWFWDKKRITASLSSNLVKYPLASTRLRTS